MDLQAIANEILWPVWNGMPPGYKSKYARSIWQQFENQVRSSAYTSSLPRFLENLSLRLDVEWPNAKTAVQVAGCIAWPVAEQGEALRMLRTEAMAAVLLVRLRNEQKKAGYQEQLLLRKEENLLDADI